MDKYNKTILKCIVMIICIFIGLGYAIAGAIQASLIMTIFGYTLLSSLFFILNGIFLITDFDEYEENER